MARRRVLLFAEAVTLAHVARANVLARALDPESYEVHAAWDPRYNQLLGSLPFTWHPIRSLPTDVFLRRVARGAPMHDVRTLRDYVREDLDTIKRVGPDVVVGDFRLSLAVSARQAGVPHVAVANAYWSPYGAQSFLFAGYEYPLSRIVGHRVARSLFRLFRPIGFAAHTRPLNVVLREHGLPGLGGDIRTMYTFGDYTAYADIPDLIRIEGLPPNHRYIGAVLWSPAVARPPWWDSLPHDREIVYVTPGTSGEEDFLSVVVDALADLPVVVIAATAGRATLRSTPSNARVADFLPGIEAASRARLVICNGGSPTTSQALAAGVPVLGLAGNNMDQHLNMEAVREAGAGVVLPARGLKVWEVRAVVEKMLTTPEYRAAAGRLAISHQRHDAGARFRELIASVST
jgi:UDP:flavonoid glycosyltransferase YjiC (YdhE family)